MRSRAELYGKAVQGPPTPKLTRSVVHLPPFAAYSNDGECHKLPKTSTGGCRFIEIVSCNVTVKIRKTQRWVPIYRNSQIKEIICFHLRHEYGMISAYVSEVAHIRRVSN